MQRDVFRKTEAGHAEVRSRALGLDARTRGLLIQINGELTVGELATRVGSDPNETLLRFVGAGLVERVTSTAPKPRPAPTAPPAVAKADAVPPAAPAPPPELVPVDPAAAWQRALIELVPHYGPDAELVAAPLRSATTPRQFALALAEVGDRLSVFLGRKGAEQLAPHRPGVNT